jgi:hypothetical protein
VPNGLPSIRDASISRKGPRCRFGGRFTGKGKDRIGSMFGLGAAPQLVVNAVEPGGALRAR